MKKSIFKNKKKKCHSTWICKSVSKRPILDPITDGEYWSKKKQLFKRKQMYIPFKNRLKDTKPFYGIEKNNLGGYDYFEDRYKFDFIDFTKSKPNVGNNNNNP